MNDAAAHDDHHEHGTGHYIKIYFILLGLFAISVIGPEVSDAKWVILITAFGIAVVKAAMVAAYFMHLNIEKRYIWYMLYTMLIFVFLFFAGVASDVMVPDGTNWTNAAAHHHIEVNKDKGDAGHADEEH